MMPALFPPKRTRILRACDSCRLKKVRCDGPQEPHRKCTSCQAFDYKCAYSQAPRKRGPPKRSSKHSETLDMKLDKLERMLEKPLHDLIQSHTSLSPPSSDNSATLASFPSVNNEHNLLRTTNAGLLMAPLHLVEYRRPKSDASLDTEKDADPILQNNGVCDDNHFMGKASQAALVKNAVSAKREFIGVPLHERNLSFCPIKRPEFWMPPPWLSEHTNGKQGSHDFPEADLLFHLFDMYFTHSNVYLPLLHRPTFERSVQAYDHISNPKFGAIVLLVCAVGSRWSDDPRVILEETQSFHSAGWKWFDQVGMPKPSFLHSLTLLDLQSHCVRTIPLPDSTLKASQYCEKYLQLSAIFLNGTNTTESTWLIVSIGLKMAQEVGAHRRLNRNITIAESELWKRAFWCLMCLDLTLSTYLGRSPSINDEDIDAELPIECDDVYWEHEDPEQRFKQPASKPSYIMFFTCHIRLLQISAFALRTIYALSKSKAAFRVQNLDWEHFAVSDLDSALNKWMDSVPEHLRWDRPHPDNIFFTQSAILSLSYNYIQILIHRPSIPNLKDTTTSYSRPSLIICANAARSSSRILEICIKRDSPANPWFEIAAFGASIVLLLNIWGDGQIKVPSKGMDDVLTCMKALQGWETRRLSSGRFWDIIAELADLPLQDDDSIKSECQSPVAFLATPDNSHNFQDHTAEYEHDSLQTKVRFADSPSYGELLSSMQPEFAPMMMPQRGELLTPMPPFYPYSDYLTSEYSCIPDYMSIVWQNTMSNITNF